MKQKKCMWILLLAVVVLLFACENEGENNVFLVAGSQGEAGSGMVYGLESGSMYLVQNGRNWYPVKSDGTLGGKLTQLNRPEVSDALLSGELAGLGAGVATITGLDNNEPVNVYKYWQPSDHFLINAWNATGEASEVVATNKRNTIIDLSEVGKFLQTQAFFGLDVLDYRSELIFITPDVDNIPQENIITGGPARIAGGSEWEYRFDGGMANVSKSRPLHVKVSAALGKKGYFTLSGEMPLQLSMISKRSGFDFDKPPNSR